MGWMGALAGIAGLVMGGLGAAKQNKAVNQQNQQVNMAQAQQAQLYQTAMSQNAAAQANAQSRIMANTGTLEAATTQAQAAVGAPVSTALRKNDGLATIATSLQGDQTTPYGARQRLLGN